MDSPVGMVFPAFRVPEKSSRIRVDLGLAPHPHDLFIRFSAPASSPSLKTKSTDSGGYCSLLRVPLQVKK